MKKRGITFKLFIITVIVFACFYSMVMLSQLLFFNQFYETYKMHQITNNLKGLVNNYANQTENSTVLARQAVQFMEKNKSQLAVINLDGKLMLNDLYELNLNDTYHLVLTTDKGQHLFIPLSFLLSEYNEPFMRAKIKNGDQLTIYGIPNTPFAGQTYQYMDPQAIQKNDQQIIGDSPAPTDSKVSGTVTELVLPDINNWKLSQGLLLQAKYEQFPLTASQRSDLLNMKDLQYGWTDSWSGSSNLITMYPLKKNGQLQVIFVLTSIQEISDTNAALRWFYLYLGIGGFLLILILSIFFSRMITRPLISLNEMASRMVRLDFSNIPPPIRQQDELGGLARSMHTMSRNLDRALHELQDANRQLQQDMEHKQKIEQMQQSFFTNASHELKTPLSIIKSFAEGLQDGVNVSKTDHYVEVIIEEADKMEMLIKDMLDLARLESGTIRLQPQSFMLSELSEKVADKLIYSLQEHHLNMTITPINERPVIADPNWIEQVLRNLIVNAIRHAEESSTIQIEIESDTQATWMHVDNKGSHIADDQLQQIWERFYRAEPSRNRQTGGTGLGLPIASQILDLHGCMYSACNLPDGVRFTIRFDSRNINDIDTYEGA